VTALSILDQAPMRVDGEPGHALRDSLALVRHADALGFRRYWVAEHHAMDCVAASSPEIVIGHLAAVTARIRVGSGGVLLPNHRALHVAEQFRTLEALHPGRIDLGVGRAQGALDDATVRALERSADAAHSGGFDEQLDELLAFGGLTPLDARHPLAGARAMPDDVPLPPVFLLGASEGSAITAARRGLGYAFAGLINPDGAAAAIGRYRELFAPAPGGGGAHVILAVRVYAAADDATAHIVASSGRLASARNRLGRPARLLASTAASAHRWDAAELAAGVRMHQEADIIGGPERVHEQLHELAEVTNADELMVLSNTYDPSERREIYEILAEVFDLAGQSAGLARPMSPARAREPYDAPFAHEPREQR
jgi:luciferase family oxidoreductase group 1